MGVIGIDASLTSTGYAFVENGSAVTGYIDPSPLRGVARLAFIRDTVASLLQRVEIDFMAIEGYAMGFNRNTGRLADIGELGGILRLLAFDRGMRILVVPPSSLKLFTLGTASVKKADKEAMMRWAAKELGYVPKRNDQADAYALYAMGNAYVNRRLLPRDRRHEKHKALEGCIAY